MYLDPQHCLEIKHPTNIDSESRIVLKTQVEDMMCVLVTNTLKTQVFLSLFVSILPFRTNQYFCDQFLAQNPTQ